MKVSYHTLAGEGRRTGCAVILLGPESGFITGAEFVIDGGVTRKTIYPK
jgi:hypothetical protein